MRSGDFRGRFTWSAGNDRKNVEMYKVNQRGETALTRRGQPAQVQNRATKTQGTPRLLEGPELLCWKRSPPGPGPHDSRSNKHNDNESLWPSRSAGFRHHKAEGTPLEHFNLTTDWVSQIYGAQGRIFNAALDREPLFLDLTITVAASTMMIPTVCNERSVS